MILVRPSIVSFRVPIWSMFYYLPIPQDIRYTIQRYAEDDLPCLEKRCQQLSSDVLELQSRKKRLGDEVATQCSSITQLEKSLNWYKMEIKQKISY